MDMDINDIRENFMTAPQAAQYLSVTRNRVGRLCLEGRFPGAGKIDSIWLIPRKAVIDHIRLKPGELKGGEHEHTRQISSTSAPC